MASPHVLLVASSGGHLARLWPSRPWWNEHERFWVTFRTPDATSTLKGENVRWARRPTTRHIGDLIRSTLLAVRVFTRHRPAVVVSTGAGVALPFFVMAKLLGVPTVRIEVYDRIDTPTLTALLCRPSTSLLPAQREERRESTPASITAGPLP
ncbi:UDP-N-acetylglucosamine--LPS N-acetylglucosamine transferase [Actinorugispora endophytica]|uniref:Oligosaccharide biosynthesis protein Alg14 n=1 Tax=Actinorugispora endophytica TaxID=1605990 RepID=A0A4R6V7Z3_9ACTN|nr:UDP-N-acetylglucosamine--LPS N-acetylglucosamine transferase [Actinorugispora endophytica]TDQ54858.1 hypothetical protein EV190_101175 [Actinorugispora endophytica]